MTVEQEVKQRRRTTPIGSGYLYEAANAFHVRYYSQEVGDDGQLHRVQKSKLLCKKDAQHPNIGCKAVRDLRQQFMAKVNTEKPSTGDMPIHQFWDRYVAYYSEVRKNGTTRKRANTVKSYQSVYGRYLEKHFGKLMLSEYEPEMGTRFLASLSAKLNINSLRHIKAIARDLFEYAMSPEHRIKSNPWDAVRLPRDAMRAKKTGAYTLDEYDAIIGALQDRLDCQLVFAIACYCGLRKGEIEGLKWEDFEGNVLHIRRAISRGVEGLPKTESSQADVIVTPQVKMFLQAWWEKKGKPREGWVFPNSHLGTRPSDLHHLGYLTIKPILDKAGLKWMNWLTCRHTCTTWLNAKGNAKLAQMQMRHANMSTTLNEYDEKITLEAHRNGILETFLVPKLLKK